MSPEVVDANEELVAARHGDMATLPGPEPGRTGPEDEAVTTVADDLPDDLRGDVPGGDVLVYRFSGAPLESARRASGRVWLDLVLRDGVIEAGDANGHLVPYATVDRWEADIWFDVEQGSCAGPELMAVLFSWVRDGRGLDVDIEVRADRLWGLRVTDRERTVSAGSLRR